MKRNQNIVMTVSQIFPPEPSYVLTNPLWISKLRIEIDPNHFTN